MIYTLGDKLGILIKLN